LPPNPALVIPAGAQRRAGIGEPERIGLHSKPTVLSNNALDID